MKLSARGRSKPLLLEEFLPYRLSMLTNTVSLSLARHYQSRFGLSIPQWRVMAVLGLQPSLSSNDVALRTAMDKVTVSRAVAALVTARHVLRRTDPADRRRAVLRLSARGREVYDQIVPMARAYEEELVGELGSRELATLDRLLLLLTKRARALSEERGA